MKHWMPTFTPGYCITIILGCLAILILFSTSSLPTYPSTQKPNQPERNSNVRELLKKCTTPLLLQGGTPSDSRSR